MQDSNARAPKVFRPRTCADCPASFVPLSTKQVRCPACQEVHAPQVAREAHVREMAKRKVDRAAARLDRPGCSECGAPLRRNNTIGRCQEHRYIGEFMGSCAHCGKPIRRDNKTGYCEEHKYPTSRAPVRLCASREGCDRQLRIDNTCGYCPEHFSESPLMRVYKDRQNARERELTRLRPDTRRFCVIMDCPNRIRSDNSTGRCTSEHAYMPVDMLECAIDRCTNSIHVDNLLGRCQEHRAKYWVARTCAEKGCERTINADCVTGYCRPHRALSEWRKIYNREYYQSRKAEFQEYARNWRLANGDDHREAVRAWNAANPEARQAMAARRRAAVEADMDAFDREMSVAYRKAIRRDPCFYCGAAKTHHVDHFYPLAKGGSDHWQGLVRACESCNCRKNATCGTSFLLRSGGLTLT